MPRMNYKTIDDAILALEKIGYVRTSTQPPYNTASKRIVRVRNEEKAHTVLVFLNTGSVYMETDNGS
jgi:hypothetical protein